MFEQNDKNPSEISDICGGENMFKLQEYKEAMLQMQLKYGKIIKPPKSTTDNIDISNEDKYGYEHFFYNENTEVPSSVPSMRDSMFDEMVYSELEKVINMKPIPKHEDTDVYKQFLDRHKKNVCNESNNGVTQSIEGPSNQSASAQLSGEKSQEEPPERQQCENNKFELATNQQWYNVYEQNLPSQLLIYHLEHLNNFLFCPLLFPTKDGQLYYQNFIRHKKYSGQYSNKLYQHTRKTFNTFVTNVKTKNNAKVENQSSSSEYLDYFNAVNRNPFEPNGRVKILKLLCTALHKQENLQVVKIENAELSYSLGMAVLLAINLKEVKRLYMYNLFSKYVDIFRSDQSGANTKEDAFDVIKKYEFDKHTNKMKNDQERTNTDCKITKIHVQLASCVQISNKTNTDNSDILNKSKIYKCCFLDNIVEFNFSESPLGLERNFKDAIAENGDSLKFLEKLHKIHDGQKKSSLNLVLYKFCMSLLSNLNSLSCNYQCLADLEGDTLKSISNHKTLECLQLFIETPANSSSSSVNIIPNDIWSQCKTNCPKLRVHFIITGLPFDEAEKFITKDIPLLSIHVSSGSMVDNNQQLLPLLRILMNQYPNTLKAVSITLWKHNLNEDLDMALINLLKNLKNLQILEYTGAVNDLDAVVDNIVKVNHGCVERIVLKVSNHSKHDVSQVYNRYCSIFQSDSVAFTLVSLDI